MSTGKRLAKRSIIGTRVCAPGDDGKYYSGVIHAVKTPAGSVDSCVPNNNANCISLTASTRYSVRFDSKAAVGKRASREYRAGELVGPGFGSLHGVRLSEGQRVFLTYNGREIAGQIARTMGEDGCGGDELMVRISPPGCEGFVDVRKRLDEVRLLESRKSARLADQDTDFARLADMAGGGDRANRRLNNANNNINAMQNIGHYTQNVDMPYQGQQGSRKRRPSSSQDEFKDDSSMDECNAALVLMSLSCSPHSPHNVASAAYWGGRFTASSSPNGSNSSSNASWRSGTPSPPLSDITPPQQTHNSHHNNTAITAANNRNNTAVIASQQHQHQHQLTHQSHQVQAPVINQNLAGYQLSNNHHGGSDEGIASDYTTDDGGSGGQMPRKKRVSALVFQCTWPGCGHTDITRKSIELHVRQIHLGPRASSGGSGGGGGSTDSGECSDDHEEEFYYTEVEVGNAGRPSPPSPPTLSHRDMARPPHEDPEYQKQLVGTFRQGLLTMCKPINIPGSIQHPWAANHGMSSPQKHVRLSPRPSTSYAPYPTPTRSLSPGLLSHSAPSRCAPAPLSPSRRARGENKKCRKVYGMEHRDQWCTQCKWKKACSRFGD